MGDQLEAGTLDEGPPLVFAPDADAPPALELCVNFGLFAGREVTPAEIDDLATNLLTKVARVSIISQRRYEIGADAEGAIHQIRVQIAPAALPSDQPDLAELRGRLLEVTERWALACIRIRNQATGAAR